MTEGVPQSLIDEHDVSTETLPEEEKSSRTTFKISESAVENLTWLAERHDTTQKRIIDHVHNVLREREENREALIEGARNTSSDETVRKAVAIDPQTRDGLNSLADDLDVSRDSLVELGIRLAKLLAKKHREKQKEMLEKLEKFFKKGEVLLDEMRGKLGKDDPLVRGLGRTQSELADIIGYADRAIESGSTIEYPF